MEKKKLIEVALPLEAINTESAREKSIRHGHPSTLHLWWARPSATMFIKTGMPPAASFSKKYANEFVFWMNISTGHS
jgi:hypothetical protein